MENLSEQNTVHANSFSRRTKNLLVKSLPKSPCCRRMLLYGILMFRVRHDNENISALIGSLEKEFSDYQTNDSDIADLSDFKKLFRCEKCRKSFLQGVFLSCGTIADPAKLYQLELAIPDSGSVEFIFQLLEELDLIPKTIVRRGITIFYYKENEAISNFLHTIGASKAAYELTNELIRKNYRNNANRHANCDTANITRTVNAAREQLDAIIKMQKNGQLDQLPPELYATAVLRLENEEASLAELAQLHHPPITKSGVNHRLKKIVEIINK